jgi:hypothetical protein
MSKGTTIYYLKMYKSVTCMCGRKKHRFCSFCDLCFNKLPENIKQDLKSKNFSTYYEDSYDNALRILKNNKREVKETTNGTAKDEKTYRIVKYRGMPRM